MQDRRERRIGPHRYPEHHPPLYARRTRRWSIYSIVQRRNAIPVPVALAGVLTQKPWIVSIAGIRKLERLDENIGAADVELTPGDFPRQQDAASQITVQGAR